MVATYRLNTNDLTENLLETIRKSFPNKEIEIIVLEQDADEYLRSIPANEMRINSAINRIENGRDLISVDENKTRPNTLSQIIPSVLPNICFFENNQINKKMIVTGTRMKMKNKLNPNPIYLPY